MPFHWSKHASYILSVFPSWREHDGYDGRELTAAEHRLRMRIPELLTQFYRSWGRRSDMVRSRETLLGPDSLTIESGALIFAEENQAIYQWGIPCERIEEEDPPVSYAWWPHDGQACVWQPSHAHLSDFLDYLIYGHALSRGAPCGGAAKERIDKLRLTELQDNWTLIELASTPMGIFPNPADQWVLYSKQGVVLDPCQQVWVAAQSHELLEEVRQRLWLTWEYKW